MQFFPDFIGTKNFPKMVRKALSGPNTMTRAGLSHIFVRNTKSNFTLDILAIVLFLHFTDYFEYGLSIEVKRHQNR